MRNPSCAAVLVVALLLSPSVAIGQDCTIAAYGDAAGTQSQAVAEFTWQSGEYYRFSIYIVMFTEDTVAAAAYKLDVTGDGVDVFLQALIAGPTGNGLVLDENPRSIGTNIALAECVLGFSGQPVLIAEYQYLSFATWRGSFVTLGPNTNQNPLYPEYVTCNDVQKDCSVGPEMYMSPVPTDKTSFSAIKSLYG